MRKLISLDEFQRLHFLEALNCLCSFFLSASATEELPQLQFSHILSRLPRLTLSLLELRYNN